MAYLFIFKPKVIPVKCYSGLKSLLSEPVTGHWITCKTLEFLKYFYSLQVGSVKSYLLLEFNPDKIYLYVLIVQWGYD